jgi:hypothetical protein
MICTSAPQSPAFWTPSTGATYDGSAYFGLTVLHKRIKRVSEEARDMDLASNRFQWLAFGIQFGMGGHNKQPTAMLEQKARDLDVLLEVLQHV